MAKKTNGSPSTAKPVVSTPVRNSSIPRPQPVAKIITHEMIAKRAYEISQSPQRGSDYDNWIRAERELKMQQSR
jgi:hypothetical protein